MFEPSRQDCQDAISRTILSLLASGLSRDKLAKLIGCSTDTIDNARDGHGLLSFEFVAMLLCRFPDETGRIVGLWSVPCTRVLTVAERLDLIEMHHAAIRREVA